MTVKQLKELLEQADDNEMVGAEIGTSGYVRALVSVYQMLLPDGQMVLILTDDENELKRVLH